MVTATVTLGAMAKPTARSDAATAATPSTLKMAAGPLWKARVVSLAPSATPASSTNWTGTLAHARRISVRWKVSAYWRAASEANPTIDAARKGRAVKIRRRERMVHTIRSASA